MRRKKATRQSSAAPESTVAGVAPARAPNRKTIKGVNISPDTRLSLYAQSRYLPKEFLEDSHLLIPFTTYFQDPFVAKTDPAKAFDERVLVRWEPGLTDGPTSSRFAIVDYNADTGALEVPATWDAETETFIGTDGKTLEGKRAHTFQFHQVSLWALLQRALAFFEDASALGRTIPWAFEGNRLIVVPHAGYGENAYYDRASKSLQFYCCGPENELVYTCLSTDIVHHEFGHAVLDGIRPLLNESVNPQTGAFHEFVGDLTAILLTLKNQTLRQRLAVAAGGKFDKATTLSSLAEEFGNAVSGRPYLRSALNHLTMRELASETSPHRLSEVLTGAMFDALKAIGEIYQSTEKPGGLKRERRTSKQVFWDAADRMQRTAIQPLDLLPPVDVTFRDYAFAVCRSQELSDPLDPERFRDMLIKVFLDRGILSDADAEKLREPHYLYDRLDVSVRHSIDDISRSRAAAYQFVDDNREDLLIPANRDFFVADLYEAKKRFRQNLPLPRQIILQYAWREEIRLEGTRFGPFDGRSTMMLCGGTLVFNENGNVLSWMRKPGSHPYGGKRRKTGTVGEAWKSAVKEGSQRRRDLLDQIAAEVAAGRIGALLGSPEGVLASFVPPMTFDEEGDMVRFRLSPHLHLSEKEHLADDNDLGDRRWQISC